MSQRLPSADVNRSLPASVVASLKRSVAHGSPYPNWRLRSVFPEVIARQLVELPFAPPALHGVSGKRELHNDTRRYFAGEVLSRHPITRRVAEAFQSPATAKAFAEHTGARLDGTLLRIEYALDTDEFWLQPHTDLGVKALT